MEPIKYLNYFPFLLGEHPRVTNAKDEECMSRYLPQGVSVEDSLDMHAKHGPFSCEDNGKYLEYAMVGEGQRGNGMGLKLWPDPSKMQDERVIHWRTFLNRFGYDEGTVMRIYPMAQGFNGGILLQDDLSTDIPGLFACGESSAACMAPTVWAACAFWQRRCLARARDARQPGTRRKRTQAFARLTRQLSSLRRSLKTARTEPLHRRRFCAKFAA